MTHFEQFDQKKEAARAVNEAWAAEDEKRLREALHALNRAIDPEWPRPEVVKARDEVWELGVRTFGWTD